MISVARLPLVSGGCEPPWLYGWCAKPVTRSRRGFAQPATAAALPRSASPSRSMHSSVRMNAAGGTERVASRPVTRPIGLVSPSSIWSRPCPLARRPAIPPRTIARYATAAAGYVTPRARANCGRSQLGWLGSLENDQRATRGSTPPPSFSSA